MNSDFVRSHIKILEDAVRAEQAKYPDRNVGPVSGLVKGVKYGAYKNLHNFFSRHNGAFVRQPTNLSMGSGPSVGTGMSGLSTASRQTTMPVAPMNENGAGASGAGGLVSLVLANRNRIGPDRIVPPPAKRGRKGNQEGGTRRKYKKRKTQRKRTVRR
jgi:hypothetical protein